MRTFLSQLTGLCLVRILCDMLLPEGDIARYADLGISLLLLLTLLRSVIFLAGGLNV